MSWEVVIGVATVLGVLIGILQLMQNRRTVAPPKALVVPATPSPEPRADGGSSPTGATVPESPMMALKRRYQRFLGRFEVEWAAERDSQEPFGGVDSGKTVLAAACHDLIDIRTELVSHPGTQDAVAMLDDAIRRMKTLEKYAVYQNVSPYNFWLDGDRIVETLRDAARLIIA